MLIALQLKFMIEKGWNKTTTGILTNVTVHAKISIEIINKCIYSMKNILKIIDTSVVK